jgi:hypothetical protein
MRKILIILFSFFSFNFCFAQTKEEKFQSTLKEVVLAFSMQDSIKLSKFIDKKIGLYQLHRIGSFDDFTYYKTPGFSDPKYPAVLFNDAKEINFQSLSYSFLPEWNCDSEAWSKKGLFVDTTKTNHLLSKICTDRNRLRPDSIPIKKINFFYNIETKSRRIILNDKKGKELVFYLSYINSDWFLTIVDNVSSDCSV